MAERVTADYLVVGAGATGMAFTDALVDHANVQVALVDRRHGAGGHWLDAYPFVRLHQPSSLYGVASTLLGAGRVQEHGPEVGLQERATAPEICAYYEHVLGRMISSGKVAFYPGCDYLGDRRFLSRVSGHVYEVGPATRVVDARYLSPEIPATTPPRFEVGDGARVVAVHELARIEAAPTQYVIAGAGKTSADTCVWLLENGVDPDSICWVRPRDPWMFNRAVVQPDPVVYTEMAADTMEAAAGATSADDFFLRMERAGVMLRIDESVTPSMAKNPTIAHWEIDLLRTIENVVRLGHLEREERGRLVLTGGTVAVAEDALTVHCTASGLRYRPMVPIWRPESITLQPTRAGLPCFGAALIGFVEATVPDAAAKNRFCPPSPLSDNPADWAGMQVLGMRASRSISANSQAKAWAEDLWLNPSRASADQAGSAELAAAKERFRASVAAGVARMAAFAGMPATS